MGDKWRGPCFRIAQSGGDVKRGTAIIGLVYIHRGECGKSIPVGGADENVCAAGQNGGTGLCGGSPPGDPRENTD